MLKKLQSALETLNTQRAQITGAGWYLQHCWLVQVKPGGSARTDLKYWQVRSRQRLFDGKTLKHLKPDEVDDYKAAIARGRRLKQIDCQIEKFQQQIAQLTAAANALTDSSDIALLHKTPLQLPTPSVDERSQTERAQTSVSFTDLSEQEQLVASVLTNSQALRESLREQFTINRSLRLKATNLMEGRIPYPWQREV